MLYNVGNSIRYARGLA